MGLPTVGIPPSLYEFDVRRQLRTLAVVGSCREPFDWWLTLTLRAKRDQMELVRPKLVTTQCSARVSVDRLGQLVARHSKLDSWIRTLSQQHSLRNAFVCWRERAVVRCTARSILAGRARGQLRQWRAVVHALRCSGLPTARRLQRLQYAAGLSALRVAARHEAWVAAMRTTLTRARAFRQWGALRGQVATARATKVVARRRHRREQLTRHLHRWRAALRAMVRMLRQGAVAHAHRASTTLWAARARHAIRALHLSSIRPTRELDEASVVHALRELGGSWAGGDVSLRHVIDERRRCEAKSCRATPCHAVRRATPYTVRRRATPCDAVRSGIGRDPGGEADRVSAAGGRGCKWHGMRGCATRSTCHILLSLPPARTSLTRLLPSLAPTRRNYRALLDQRGGVRREHAKAVAADARCMQAFEALDAACAAADEGQRVCHALSGIVRLFPYSLATHWLLAPMPLLVTPRRTSLHELPVA